MTPGSRARIRSAGSGTVTEQMIRIAASFSSAAPAEKREPYRKALREAGIEPVENFTGIGELAGLLLAGGSDVAPELYGAVRQPETGEPDPERDRRELALVNEAFARDLPLLAICRGVQVLNVAMGGTLVQHIEGHTHGHAHDAHPVIIAPGTRLASILGAGDYIVNSRHHQCVGRTAPGAIVAAKSPDGIVEAIEFPDKRFVLGVQWHPEDRTGGPDAKIFSAFREALNSP